MDSTSSIPLGKLFSRPANRLHLGLAFFAPSSYFPLQQGFQNRGFCPNPFQQPWTYEISIDVVNKMKNYVLFDFSPPPADIMGPLQKWGSGNPKLQLWQFFTASTSEKVAHPSFLSWLPWMSWVALQSWRQRMADSAPPFVEGDECPYLKKTRENAAIFGATELMQDREYVGNLWGGNQ